MTGFDIDEDAIRKLASLMEETGLSEIEVSDGEKALRVAKTPELPAWQMAPQMTLAAAPAGGTDTHAQTGSGAAQGFADADILTSPMVGTAYVAPEPNAGPFVSVGDRVTPETTVMIIEAMKVMNPIRAHKAGTVKKIMVSDAQPVEYGEALLVIA